MDDYNLFIKNWKTGTLGFQLSIDVNGNKITKYVDSREGEGGENNFLSVSLRNKDFSSIDYHNYLLLGFNTITITITPIGGTVDSGSQYHMRAISVEKV